MNMDPTLVWQIKMAGFLLLIFNVIGWGVYYIQLSRQEAAAKIRKPAVPPQRNLPLHGASYSRN